MQSNSVEELRMCQTHCRTVDWANASVRFFYSQFHLYCIVVAELLHFYFIWFFSSQREVRWSWPFTSESWGWGPPKSFLLARQQLQLLFFFPSLQLLTSHSKCHDYENINFKIDIYTSWVNLWGQILAFWTPLTILEPSHLSIWKELGTKI